MEPLGEVWTIAEFLDWKLNSEMAFNLVPMLSRCHGSSEGGVHSGVLWDEYSSGLLEELGRYLRRDDKWGFVSAVAGYGQKLFSWGNSLSCLVPGSLPSP